MNTKGVESVGRSRVRGKKRMEIIKKFMNGEEDPDYEVLPTVTEGKYFVRPRREKASEKKRRDKKNYSEEEEINEEYEVKSETKHKDKKASVFEEHTKHQAKQQPRQQMRRDEFYDPTVTYQILEQLKLLGEEQRLKREKKEQKKLVKHQIRKELKRKEESSSEEYNYDVVDEEPKILYRPTQIRRRVNLVK